MVIEKQILNRKWTLWFDAPYFHSTYNDYKNKNKWISNIENVYIFNNIGDFWRLFNNILIPQNISYKSSYYLYEHNTKPYWCDINHLNGGMLSFNIIDDEIDKIWEIFVVSFVGESIAYTEYVTGLKIKKNKNYFTISLSLRGSNELIIDYFNNEFIKYSKDNKSSFILYSNNFGN